MFVFIWISTNMEDTEVCCSVLDKEIDSHFSHTHMIMSAAYSLFLTLHCQNASQSKPINTVDMAAPL